MNTSDPAVSGSCPSPSQRKEPVGGENNGLEVKERRKQTEDAENSLHECLGHKDRNVLLAMRDQARLVSTAIQLLTSPESSCLHASSSVCHKVCCSEAAEPDDLNKPHSQVETTPHHHWPSIMSSLGILIVLNFLSFHYRLTDGIFSVLLLLFFAQISELSDLVDRPLVAALTSRLQALHAHLQSFVEQVDGLVKAPAGGKGPEEEGERALVSNGSPLPCSGDSQDGAISAEEKVNTEGLVLFHSFSFLI